MYIILFSNPFFMEMVIKTSLIIYEISFLKFEDTSSSFDTMQII